MLEMICSKKTFIFLVRFPAKSEAVIVFFFLVCFGVATMQNKLDPRTANINKFPDYFD